MENKTKTKLILLASMSIAFASCKKDETQLVQPQTRSVSMEKQVTDLIQKADKNLYDEMYNQQGNNRAGTIKVEITPGVFMIPKDANGNPDYDSGTCAGHQSICHITITSAASADSSISGEISVMANNVTTTYPNEANARLILNTESPIVQNISELSTSLDEKGNVHIQFKKR
ncbi:MAG: hypothetical protein ACT4ON_04915 [Bacteroidota bacterium]